MPYSNEKLLKIVNGHGYLLQQAVEHHIKSRPKDPFSNWEVLTSEHYWKHSRYDRSGYIDLVIWHPNGFVGVVECKRYAEETPWIFLCPSRPDGDRIIRSAAHWAYINPHKHSKTNGWAIFTHAPASYQARFCVVHGQTKEKPMLERIAGELLYSVEALADQSGSLFINGRGDVAMVLLPIIVTTADLYVCSYNLEQIDPNNGELAPAATTFEKVPYVRFHKVFTDTPVDLKSSANLGEVEEKQRQTVMVVQAAHLDKFLSECKELARWAGTTMPWEKEG